MTMARTTIALLVAALFGTACSGPREPLDVGVREVASDIVLGTQGRTTPAGPTAAPIPPAPVAVNVPTPVRLPAPNRFPSSAPTEPAVPTPTPAPRCPVADPLSVPRHPATDTEGAPPVAGGFTVANVGTFTVSGANANQGSFEETSNRFVRDVAVDDDGEITYNVVANLAGTATQSSYLLRNTRAIDDGLGVGDQANLDQGRGLFLTAVVTRLPDDRLVAFRPTPPLRLLRFPAFEGDTYDEVATDPTSGTSMQYTVTVGPKVRVDACGSFIEAIRVHLTQGRVLGTEQDLEFVATYDIATQYGGLIVRDEVTASGREGLDTITRTNIATFLSVPTHASEADA